MHTASCGRRYKQLTLNPVGLSIIAVFANTTLSCSVLLQFTPIYSILLQADKEGKITQHFGILYWPVAKEQIKSE
jgi:hypothetical protein